MLQFPCDQHWSAGGGTFRPEAGPKTDVSSPRTFPLFPIAHLSSGITDQLLAMFQELSAKGLRTRSLAGLICARRIHLLHQIYSKIPHPQIMDMPFKDISDIELAPCTLTGSTISQTSSKAMLSDILKSIRPMQYMHVKLPGGVETIRFEDASRYSYSIKEFQLPTTKRKDEQKRAGNSKELHITTSLHPLAFEDRLRTAYGLLQAGKRVEFHLRPRNGDKNMTVDWALRNLPYLRPDVMLRSMPERTVVIVPPVENKERQELIWAFSRQPIDQGNMRPKKGRTITPDYDKAVKKSQKLEPQQWQGFRDDEAPHLSDETMTKWQRLRERTSESTTGPFKIHRQPSEGLVNPSQSTTTKKLRHASPKNYKTR